jgi:integrase/recombinase XerD
VPTRAAARSFASLARAYLDERRHCCADTQRQARGVLGRFGETLRRAGRRDVRAIGEADLVRFLASQAHLTLGTRRAYLSVLRSFFAWAVGRGWLLSSPVRGLALPSSGTLPRRVPSQAQVGRLLAHVGSWAATATRDRALLEVLYGSGLRRAECVRLELRDVDLRQAMLLVRNGKGRRDRLVPLTKRAVSALGAYLEERPRLDTRGETALFLSARGGPLTGSGLAKMVRRAATGARLTLSPHGLRHACATHLLEEGADVRLIQRLLGHSRLATTALYTRVRPVELFRVLRRCHPRELR